LLLNIVHSDEWSGNQEVQDAFCKALEAADLKDEGTQYDPKSGGPRTYFSQMKCLGLLFLREDGRVYLTKAGEDLAGGDPPLPIMQSMLLRHQYPSAYGDSRNVRINPQLKVKPFLFVLRLLNHPDVGYLTNKELVVPVVFAHDDGCFDLCVEKILRIRRGASIFDVAIGDELYLPRALEDREHVEKNLIDIANTCKNYMEACGLVNVERVDGEERISFSEDARTLYDLAIAKKDEFIPMNSEEQFQRAYGAWDRVKDTRRLVPPVKPVTTPEGRIILSKFYELCGKRLIAKIPEDFLDSMKRDFGFDKEKVKDVIAPHIAGALGFYESTFLDLARGGARKSTEFEKAVCGIFEEKLHFRTRHTGPMKRRGGVGGYADVFAVALDERHCAILDTKASPSYNLPASDYHAMENNYIPNYRDLADGTVLDLEFAAYVAGGFSGDVDSKLRSLKTNTRIGCSAIRARDLLDLAQRNPAETTQPAIRAVFQAGRLIGDSDFVF
jgi:hypothetical protein